MIILEQGATKMTKRRMEQRKIVKRSGEQEKIVKRSREHRKMNKEHEKCETLKGAGSMGEIAKIVIPWYHVTRYIHFMK